MARQDIYCNFFNLNNLIKYGYYDAPIKIKINHFNQSVSYGLPDSIYEGLLDLEELIEILDSSRISLPGKRLDTEPLVFSIPKTEFTRRVYKFPNFYSYYIICKFLVDNKEIIETAFANDINSTSKFFNIEGFEYEKTKEIEKNILQFGKSVLNLDLSNFYPTLYTHSIDWAERGKNQAKASRKTSLPGQIALDLDELIRNCQFGETHGVPTGTLMARVVTEYYMTFFDARLRNANYQTFTRYVDDFKFSYISEQEKEGFLREFTTICNELGLNINTMKTYVESYPSADKYSKAFIKNWDLELNSRKWDSTLRASIHNIIDHCIYDEKSGGKGYLKYLLAALRYKISNKETSTNRISEVFLESGTSKGVSIFERLLDISLSSPSLTNNFLRFSNVLKEYGDDISLKINGIVNKYYSSKVNISSLIKLYSKNNLHQELYQILLYAYEFKVHFEIQSYVKDIFTVDSDDFSMILAILIYYRNIQSKNDWLHILSEIDSVLSQTHSAYQSISRYSRMREQHWLLRYFIYTFINSGYIEESVVSQYSIGKGYKNYSKGGFETELNSRYVFNIDKSDVVSNFYKDLLDNDVNLINLSDL
ncbi:RNA-directed DNA polymerase [Rothia nasimurium]|uniref:RNA-directed DNA polymerase n=1 Tax=Rothia nasimurium TaxID=85336 RepID=UPI001F15C35B|nr:RNA-directed DNA polymerase [Rothia nasimurium]